MHGDAGQAEAVVDHDAISLEIKWLREDDGAGVAGQDGGAAVGAEVRALVDTGELAVEHPAGSKAVGGLSIYRCNEIAGPERMVGAFGEGFFFGFGGSFDPFLVFGARFDEFRLNGNRTGAVVRGVNGYGRGDFARGIVGMHGDLQRGGAKWAFDINTGERVPDPSAVRMFARRGFCGEKLQSMALPLALDGCL